MWKNCYTRNTLRQTKPQAASGGRGRDKTVITKGIKQLCAEAEQEIETMTVEEVMAVREDEDVVLVDIRDVRELWRDGTIPGAQHMPRGMLEFWVDPESPITGISSPPARSSSFTAPAGCARRWPQRRSTIWGLPRWRICAGATVPG